MSGSGDACQAVIMLPALVFHMFLPEQEGGLDPPEAWLDCKKPSSILYLERDYERHHLHLT